VVHKLDFRDAGPYVDGVDWVRSNVVLKQHPKGQVLQLDVALRALPVTLYMDPWNHYIMGFQGADRIYLLDDDETGAFKKALKIQGPEPEIIKSLGGGHHAQGLGTFQRKPHGGVVGRIFYLRDMATTALLPTYSRKSGIKHDQLQLPLSLLVCMISEAARIPMLQRDFKNMYYDHPVYADDAMRSYDDAKFLIHIAVMAFPNYPVASGMEKVEKRAALLATLLEKIQTKSNTGLRGITLIAEVLNEKKPWEPSVATFAKDFRDECKQLHIADAAVVSQLLSTCRSEGAVRAAKQGVAIPPISP